MCVAKYQIRFWLISAALATVVAAGCKSETRSIAKHDSRDSHDRTDSEEIDGSEPDILADSPVVDADRHLSTADGNGPSIDEHQLTLGTESWENPITNQTMQFVETREIRASDFKKIAGDVPLRVDDQIAAALNGIRSSRLFVTGFYMDKYEVTNRAYEHFVSETGSSIPPDWPNGKPSADRLDFPVLVTLEEAKAYAAWAGLRLPKVYECFSAIADEDGRYPWTKDLGLDEMRRRFALAPEDAVQEVGSNAIDKSPKHLFDLVGNGGEWLSTTLQLEGTDLYGCFLLYTFDDEASTDYLAWYSVADPNERKAFRCCYTPAQVVLAPDAHVFELPDPDADVCVKIEVMNMRDVTIQCQISNGHRIDVRPGESVDVHLISGVYLITAFELGAESLGEIQHVLVDYETSPRMTLKLFETP